jgi:hypothetical protein
MGPLPDMKGAILAFAVVCALIGVALAYGVPWLWGLVKPLLHAVTA